MRIPSVAILLVGLISMPGLAIETGASGGNQAHSNTQPVLGVNHIIALNGVYPSRDGPMPAETFVGEVGLFAGNFAPRGWAMADGQLIAISSHTALFSLLGTTYGGDGRSTFALPDLRGRTAIQPGTGPGLARRNLGQKFGSYDTTLELSQIPAHSHGIDTFGTQNAGGGQSHSNVMPSLGLNHVVTPVGVPDALGEIRMFAGTFAPGGYFADGQLISISSNPLLYDKLGTAYGGDGRTTFALPDLRGRTAIGAGMGTGLSNRRRGQKTGDEQVTLSMINLPSHDHSLPQEPHHTLVTGGNLPHENMQPSLVMNYVIALTGVYPSRSAPLADGPGGGAQAAIGSEPFIGQVSLIAGNDVPTGWTLADGSLLPISQYSALFSLLGTTYGGDGRTTFGLPDLRGRTLLGTSGAPAGRLECAR